MPHFIQKHFIHRRLLECTGIIFRSVVFLVFYQSAGYTEAEG